MRLGHLSTPYYGVYPLPKFQEDYFPSFTVGLHQSLESYTVCMVAAIFKVMFAQTGASG